MLRRSLQSISGLTKRVNKNELATVTSEGWAVTDCGEDPRIFVSVGHKANNFKVEKSKRLVNPPQFKAANSYCHYPILIVASPMIVSTDGYKSVEVTPRNNSCWFTKSYFVDVPFEVCPGELFRVLIAGDEYLVPCPDIDRPGERIVVSMAVK